MSIRSRPEPVDEKEPDMASSPLASEGTEVASNAVANEESKLNAISPPPDTLRGWMVVSSSFILFMLVTGYTNSFGVYLQEYQLHVFPTTPSSTLSWIGSLQFGFICLFGVVGGVLVEQYKSQIIVAIGGILMGACLLISSACNSPIALIFTQGILFGASGSLVLIPTMSLPGQWMDKYRALATGITVAGGSIGGLWMSYAVRALLSSVGYKWALRATALIMMVFSVGLSPLMKKRFELPRRSKIIDFRALKSAPFALVFLATIFAGGAYYMPYYFMTSYSAVVLKLSKNWGANISSMLNASSIVGRIATGILGDRVGTLNTMFVTFLISAVSLFAIWLPFKSLGTLVASAVVFGIASSSIDTLLPVVTAELFGIERLSSILGLMFISYTIGTFISAPVGGVLLDDYGH
ncbi:hypothetical protein IWW48_000834 [Coemansia sp. RSA 1200]|nr:hypothetical protein IWW48_000834 [Coemansia sp. RSA 1200]